MYGSAAADDVRCPGADAGRAGTDPAGGPSAVSALAVALDSAGSRSLAGCGRGESQSRSSARALRAAAAPSPPSRLDARLRPALLQLVQVVGRVLVGRGDAPELEQAQALVEAGAAEEGDLVGQQGVRVDAVLH